MKYFPFLRGKQSELMAIRQLAGRIVESGNVMPIIEPVNSNSTTRISIDRFVEESMPFLLICNPMHGEFSEAPEDLYNSVISQALSDFDLWWPSLYVDEATTPHELEAFFERYDELWTALICSGRPQRNRAREVISERTDDIYYHVFMRGRVETDYIQSIPADDRVIIEDRFHRQAKNADYPAREFFTDMNTRAGNPDGIDFGDFSIVGDHFFETGGPAFAVALHHIHFEDDSRRIAVSHFISDRTDTSVDTPGKIVEALDHLVDALPGLQPNDTATCGEYRDLRNARRSRGLPYMKRLAIQHHLEVILDGGIEA